MKFGKVDNPESIDFKLPSDPSATTTVIKKNKSKSKTQIHVGCAKWNRQDLKNFYPRGTKDELSYYSTQFNSIELNATFYRIFSQEQVAKWYEKTPDNFKFFPKIPQIISQFRRLKNCEAELDQYLLSINELKQKLGTIFLQMHPYFAPKSFEDLKSFIINWPKDIKLAVELRHADWYSDDKAFQELCHLLQENNISHIVVDTAGRRDLVHMRLTNSEAFIRYNGANHSSDYTRLDDWFERIKSWVEQGIKEINFFVHQNTEKESPLLSAHLIKKINSELGYDLHVPQSLK